MWGKTCEFEKNPQIREKFFFTVLLLFLAGVMKKELQASTLVRDLQRPTLKRDISTSSGLVRPSMYGGCLTSPGPIQFPFSPLVERHQCSHVKLGGQLFNNNIFMRRIFLQPCSEFRQLVRYFIAPHVSVRRYMLHVDPDSLLQFHC